MHHDFSGGSFAADRHGPEQEAERWRQAARPGPRMWVIVAIYLGFVFLAIVLGIVLLTKSSSGFDRVAGWILLVSGGVLVLFGGGYLARCWLSAPSAPDSLFCANDDANELDRN